MTLSDPRFWKTTLNTVYWTVGSTFFAFVLGFGAALALHEPFPGRGIVRAVLLIPWVVSAVAAAYVWRWVLHSDFGLVSGTLMQWGVIDRPLVLLDSKTRVMPTLIAVNVWKEFPFVMIMMTAGLQTVPEGLLRAARVDGAGTWHQFWHVTVPHLRGIVLITTLLLFVGNLNSFTLVWLMTGGGPANASQLWITEIYNTAFRKLQYGLASAFSVILFIIMLALGYFYVKALTANAPRQEG
jgi:multiple sugar transport system permease protein